MKIPLWVQLSSGLSMPEFCQAALSHNVFITDGMYCFPNHQGYNAMRLTFAHKPEAIEHGISILGKLLKDYQK